MSALEAVRTLDVLPNAIHTRLQRIIDITGHNAERYQALTELPPAAECRRR